MFASARVGEIDGLERQACADRCRASRTLATGGRTWEIVTREIRDHEGGLGSRLHRAADGTWVAYAQWPSRELWERAEVSTPEGLAALRIFSGAIKERLEPILLDPVSDFLVREAVGT
jgi:hypothetical protein